MTQPVAQRIYDCYGRFYAGFEWVFHRRVTQAIAALNLLPDQRVLDVGIGTGLSLDIYPPGIHLTGIDLSAVMLRQATRRLAQAPGRLAQVTLLQADAQHLPFAAGSFDCVFMSHVIAVVPDPARTMAEALRVCREGGRIALVNHFASPYPVVSWLEKAIDPICRYLGWRTDLALRDLLAPLGIASSQGVAGTLFQTVYLRKTADAVRLLDAHQLQRVAAIALMTGAR